MPQKTPHGIYDLKQYREHTQVFRDRIHAGDVLANPSYGVCLFQFYGICNEQELASGCVYGMSGERGEKCYEKS